MKFSSILMAVLLALITGCKSTDSTGLNPERVDETRAVIESIIEEPDRRMTMLAVVDSMENKVTDIGAEVTDIRLQIVEANQDYDTTRGDLEVLYTELGKRAERLVATVKKHSLELRMHCSETEWAQLTDTKTQTFDFSF